MCAYNVPAVDTHARLDTIVIYIFTFTLVVRCVKVGNRRSLSNSAGMITKFIRHGTVLTRHANSFTQYSISFWYTVMFISTKMLAEIKNDYYVNLK